MNYIKKHPWTWVLIGSLMMWGATFFMHDKTADDSIDKLPWKSQVLPNGHHKALGLITHESTLKEAMFQYGREVDVKMFMDASGRMDIEAFFDAIRIAGLGAKLIVRLDVPEKHKQAIFDRGLEIMKQETGNWTIELSPADRNELMDYPINLLTLIPKTDLDEDIINNRFGVPDTKTPDSTNPSLTHWRYLDRQMNIIVDPKAKEIIEYY